MFGDRVLWFGDGSIYSTEVMSEIGFSGASDQYE